MSCRGGDSVKVVCYREKWDNSVSHDFSGGAKTYTWDKFQSYA